MNILKTEFQKDFSLPDNCEIQLVEGEYNVFSSEGYLLCSLLFKNVKTFYEINEHLVFVCFILAYIFLHFIPDTYCLKKLPEG